MRRALDPGFYHSEELEEIGFRQVGENVRISRDCVVIGVHNVVLGHDIRIDSGTTIIATQGTLTLTGWNHIGGQCHFTVAADLTFGEYAGTSQGVRVIPPVTISAAAPPQEPDGAPDGVRIRPIVIDRYVGIGSGAVILPGCHIREGSCVGALSLVNRPLRPWGIYHGNPVKRIGERPRQIDNLLEVVRARLSH